MDNIVKIRVEVDISKNIELTNDDLLHNGEANSDTFTWFHPSKDPIQQHTKTITDF